MSRYRKISVRMWVDDKFLELSKPKPNAQTLWFYLLTGPHTTALPCAFMAGEATLAEGLVWPISAFRKVFQEVFDKGMVQADWKARMVFLPNGLRHNPPENPNVVKSWRTAFNELPDCPLKLQVFAAVKTYLQLRAAEWKEPEAFIRAFGEDYVKVFTKTEQEQNRNRPETGTDQRQKEGMLALGEFGNVLLTPDDLADLRTRLTEHLDGLIAELDRYGETHPKEFSAYKNHKAVLLTWYGRRKQEHGKTKNRQERSAENARSLLSRLDSQDSGSDECGIERGNAGGLLGAVAKTKA